MPRLRVLLSCVGSFERPPDPEALQSALASVLSAAGLDLVQVEVHPAAAPDSTLPSDDELRVTPRWRTWLLTQRPTLALAVPTATALGLEREGFTTTQQLADSDTLLSLHTTWAKVGPTRVLQTRCALSLLGVRNKHERRTLRELRAQALVLLRPHLRRFALLLEQLRSPRRFRARDLREVLRVPRHLLPRLDEKRVRSVDELLALDAEAVFPEMRLRKLFLTKIAPQLAAFGIAAFTDE